MSILDTIKVWVGPVVYRKDGSPSMGSFGTKMEPGCIVDCAEWKKLDAGVRAIEKENAELKADAALGRAIQTALKVNGNIRFSIVEDAEQGDVVVVDCGEGTPWFAGTDIFSALRAAGLMEGEE